MESPSTNQPQLSLLESVGNVLASPSAPDINGNVIGALPSIQSWYSLLPGEVDWKSTTATEGGQPKDVWGVVLQNQVQKQVENDSKQFGLDLTQLSSQQQYQSHQQQQQYHQGYMHQYGAQYAPYQVVPEMFPPNAASYVEQTPSFVSIGSHPDVVSMLMRCMENDSMIMPENRQEKHRKIVTTVSTQTVTEEIHLNYATMLRAPCRFLYEFLEFLLSNSMYGSLIQWRNKEKRIFTLVDHHRVAELWGVHKRKKGMCYEKFSRALRFYYRKNILKKEPGRFTYRFVNQPSV